MATIGQVGIDPGELREKLEFYSLVKTPNGSGGFLPATPVLAFSAFAKVVPMKAHYDMQNGRLSIDTPYKVTIRYASSKIPNVAQTVKYRGRDYRILEVADMDVYKRLVYLVIAR